MHWILHVAVGVAMLFVLVWGACMRVCACMCVCRGGWGAEATCSARKQQ